MAMNSCVLALHPPSSISLEFYFQQNFLLCCSFSLLRFLEKFLLKNSFLGICLEYGEAKRKTDICTLWDKLAKWFRSVIAGGLSAFKIKHLSC
jgi:hypothetical protein